MQQIKNSIKRKQVKIDYKQKVKCKNKVDITMKVKEYFNKRTSSFRIL